MRRTKGTSVDPIFVLDSATLRRTRGTSVDPIFFCWTLLRCEGRKAPASTQYLFLTLLRCAGREVPASTQYFCLDSAALRRARGTSVDPIFVLTLLRCEGREAPASTHFFFDSSALCTRSTSLEQSCGTAISRTWDSAHQADESFYRFSLCQVPQSFFSLAPDAVNYGGSKCPCAWIKAIPRKNRWIKVAKLVDQSFAS